MPDEGGGAPTPYIPNTDADRQTILQTIGAASVDALFADVPAEHRDPAISLPPSLSESELREVFSDLADRNSVRTDRPVFLGAGAYNRYVPAVVSQLTSRFEFSTAYTPYQPEISQGTLQSAFEYQSVVCDLTGLDVSNTGLYDVAAATAEACLLAARATKRRSVALLEPMHPGTVDVVRTYAFGADIEVDIVADARDISDRHACLAIQQPDFLGGIVDVEQLAEKAHTAGALCIVITDPLTLGLLRAPGDAGADVVTGEGRDLAGPIGFGGPSLGLFAARKALLRQVPGRIVGRTSEIVDAGGDRPPKTGYVLTLQAREQFIRRERATSNFSTGQALVALGFTIAMQALGPEGLRGSANVCYQKAHSAAKQIAALSGFDVIERGPWFQEFLVNGPLPPAEVLRRLACNDIVGGLDVSTRPEPEADNAFLVAVTEATPESHIERLVCSLAAIGCGD